MKLAHAFYHLPYHFDAGRLQQEVAQFADDEWLAHPTGFRGNSAIPLIAAEGESNDDFAISGPMQPTPALQRCPYMQQVLAALHVPLSRSRLMRVAGWEQVPPHQDADYHWFRRTRVHIPVVTSPEVTFHCDGQTVHMAAGEAWTFDNTRLHAVRNAADKARIHLVFDTMGTPTFWRLCAPAVARAEHFSGADVSSTFMPYQPDTPATLALEPYRFEVFTPREITVLITDIQACLCASGSTTDDVRFLATRLATFARHWHEAFERYGHDQTGELAYWRLLAGLEDELMPWCDRLDEAGLYALKVLTSMLKTTNRSPSRRFISSGAPASVSRMTVDEADCYVLASQMQDGPGVMASVPLPPKFVTILHCFRVPATLPQAYDRCAGALEVPYGTFVEHVQKLLALRLLVMHIMPPVVVRPVFVVAAPRSGSMLLGETLMRSTDIWWLDDAEDAWIASIPALSTVHRDYESDRVTADDVTPECVAMLQQHLPQRLWHAQLAAYAHLPRQHRPAALRLVSCGLTNALRMPFLKTVFPDALFIYVYRQPADTMSSIMDAWRAGKLVTYECLPGWPLRSWSFALPPGWRYLHPTSLAEVAAFQWIATNECILHDLAQVPTADWCLVRYTDLIANPAREIGRLRHFARLHGTTGAAAAVTNPLPLSCTTLSPPQSGKWRKNEAALRPVLPLTRAVAARVASLG